MELILFTGGGSAGHVVPNLAVMRELRYAFRLAYMGAGGIEERLVKEAGYPFFRVDCPKLRRSLSAENLKIPLRLHRAKREALQILTRERPALVFSKGGYVSYPAVWASARLHIPAITHESDLTPGLCTKLIAKKCAYVLTSFEETAKRFPNGKYAGPPLRRELFTADRARALHKYGLSPKKPVLLVFGGGSGSRVLNEAVQAALPDLLGSFSVLHATGGAPAEPKEGYVPLPYLNDMAGAYAAADVVLCRAGSNAVFEALALKKPAVLVPLAHASRGDQLENARYFEQKGLVRTLPEDALSTLFQAVKETYSDLSLKERLLRADIADGTGEIVRLIRKTVGQGASE